MYSHVIAVRYMKATPGESIILVAVSHVPELHVIEEGERGLVIGGAVTLVKLQSVIDSMVTRMPGTYESSHGY